MKSHNRFRIYETQTEAFLYQSVAKRFTHFPLDFFTVIQIWDINTNKQKLVIKAHKREIRALAFGASGHRKLFSAGDDRQLLCHDIEVNRVGY